MSGNYIVKNSKLLIFIDQVLVSSSNFILGILLARYLGIDGYGQFALLWLIIIFFSSLQLSFIISPMMTIGGKRKSLHQERYLFHLLYIQAIFSIFLSFCLFVFFKVAIVFDAKWDIGASKPYIIVTVFIFLTQDFLRRYFIMKVEYLKLILIDIIAYFGQIFFVGYYIFYEKINIDLVFRSIIFMFGLSLLLGYLYINAMPFNMRYFIIVSLKNWHFSKWLIYSSILQWGSGNFFILAGGALLGNWSVGVIRVMQNTMGVFHVLFLALENILPINFSKIYDKSGYSAMMKYMKQYGLYGIGSFLLIILAIYPFSTNIIKLLYGDEYIKYSDLLIWFLVIYLFIYIGMLIRYVLRTKENTKIIFYGYVVNLFFSLGSSYFLIKLFGINGVVIGMLIIQIIMNLMMYKYIKHESKIK